MINIEEYQRVREVFNSEFGAGVAAVAAYYGDDNRPGSYFTAHFFEVDGTWALVTAGHCLTGLLNDRAMGNEPRQILVFDPKTTTTAPLPIRLEYDRMIAIYDEDSGKDYGFVVLDPLYSGALASGGMKPCSVENVAPSTTEFDFYYLFGYPGEHLALKEGSESITVSPGQTALRLDRMDDSLSKPFRRLQFRCNLESVEGLQDLNRIEGMSGGLVVGLRQADGGIESGLVGIQSTWIPGERTLLVCPHDAFFGAIKSVLAKRE